MTQVDSPSSLATRTPRFRVLLVLFVGLGVSALVALFVKGLQEDRASATYQALSSEYLYTFERAMDRQSRFLNSIAGQVVLSPGQVSSVNVFRKINGLKYLTTDLPDDAGIAMMQFVPFMGDIASSIDGLRLTPFEKTHLQTFLNQHEGIWEAKGSVPLQNETVILGVDKLDGLDKRYLVLGHPFFQSYGSNHEGQTFRQYAAGYLLAWVDLGHLLRKSWNDKRSPEHVIEVEFANEGGQGVYVFYQSGLLTVTQTAENRLQRKAGHRVAFKLLGKSGYFNLTTQNASGGELVRNFHWIVFAIGALSSVLWCLIAMRVRLFKSYPQTAPVPEPDVSQKLANETQQRRVAEDVLAMNRARWHFVVDNLPVSLFAVERSGMFTLGEGRGLTALGLEPGKVEGNSIFEVFADQPHLIEIMRESLSGEEKHELVQIDHHWFDMRFSPVVLYDGSFDGMICVATDVTGEHNVRERLDKVNLHLRGLMDNVPIGVAFIRGGIIQWCSRRLEEIFGLERDALKGRSPEILYDNVEDFETLENEAREMLRQQDTFIKRVLFKRPDKTRFLGEIRGRLVDRNNFKAGTIWVLQDLTRFLQEEKERRLSKTVFDNVVEGVLVLDADRKIVQVNKAFESITGFRKEEVIGELPAILRSNRHDQAFFNQMWEESLTRGEWEGEVWNKRKNGQIYLAWLNISVLRDDAGQVDEYVFVFNDITSHHETQEQLIYQSNYDLLTGLPNRHLLSDRFRQAVAMAKREKKPFCLLYLDLDNFKYLNESLGLEAGDHVIKTVAQRLDKSLRSVDTIARISGDEFIVLLIGAGDEEAASRAVANLSMVVSQPIQLDSQAEDILMSASCGIALYPRDGETLEELTPKAEAAMHHAKEIERGLFMFFTKDMNVRAQERLLLETKLRKALDRDEFELYYQPKVDLTSGKIYGAEALIRWVIPDMGLIGPDKFIPIAEETGLIVPIGDWVFKTACAQLKKWQDAGLAIENVAVNLSGRQFAKPDLAHELISIVREYDLSPESLEIEITESFIASSESGAVDALTLLSNTGIKLSLDDFGTGYSSLNYLHRFPLDIMKIDRSFLMPIGEENENRKSGNLARAVIAIAKSMDLKIVGEGVETEKQLAFLCENGCDYMQGYYFSKPVPADEFEKLLRSGRTL
ncbi:EAL and GGDEF domain-containing protein [Terasakiella pusilla]|uniref:sensor domain-containing protein n=1 Tax=Terasakiella pusilla TaxID=64973 RepID=UPI003AA8ABBB